MSINCSNDDIGPLNVVNFNPATLTLFTSFWYVKIKITSRKVYNIIFDGEKPSPKRVCNSISIQFQFNLIQQNTLQRNYIICLGIKYQSSEINIYSRKSKICNIGFVHFLRCLQLKRKSWNHGVYVEVSSNWWFIAADNAG